MKFTKEQNLSSNSIGKDTLRLTVSKVITLCITMVTAMLLSRFRTLEEYGTYSQLLLVTGLASSVFMLGLPNSINFFLARLENPEEKRRFLSSYYTLSTILCIVMGGVLVLATPLIVAYFDNPGINAFIYFLAVYPWASVISSGIENILVVYGKTRFLMLYKLINSIFLLGIVIIIQLLELGFKEYILCFVILNALFAIFVYCISSKLCGGLKACFDKTLVKSLLVFSIPLGLATVVGTLDIEIDKLLIGYLMDTEQLAIYTNASKELPLTIIAASITAVLLPQITIRLKNKQNLEAVKLWTYATEMSFIFMSIMVAGIFTYAEDVMTILYSGKYLPGISVFRIYTLFLLLRVTYFGIFLNANGETKKILWCSIVALGLNAVLNPLFYHMIGMEGPAIATLLSVLIITLTQLTMTSHSLCVKFKDLFPWKRCGIILMINAALSILFFKIKQWLPLEVYIGSIAESIILGIIWVAVYLVLQKKRIVHLWKLLNV